MCTLCAKSDEIFHLLYSCWLFFLVYLFICKFVLKSGIPQKECVFVIVWFSKFGQGRLLLDKLVHFFLHIMGLICHKLGFE